MSALLTVAAFVAGVMLRGTFPFGEASRNTNDLGQQFIPMHAYLRDVLTGAAPGDLVFSWSSGFGVPFLGDFMAYLGGTFSWIVVLFPRDGMDLALYVIAVLAVATAAAAMTAYLRLLRPTGPAWLAVVAGVSYALCGWAMDDAVYMTVWLNGLVAFPVLCLVCEWILRRRTLLPLVVSPFVVALLWTSHFYTVYMATIGAAIVVLARVLSYDASVSARRRITGVLRCALAVVAGIGLAAPLLVPTFWAVRYSRPSPHIEFQAMDWTDFLSRLLAGSEGVGTSPGLAVGTVLLLLALSLPVNSAVARRERLVWTGAVVLTLVSMQVTLTHEVWHGFDTPNGSPFRQAFVVAGLLVIAGWLSGSAGLRGWVPVVVPLALVAALYVGVRDGQFVTETTRLVVPIMALAAVVAWLAGRRSWAAVPAVIVVGAAVVVEATAGVVAIDEARSRIIGAHPTWGDTNDQVRELVLAADAWPESRVAPGGYVTQNDPMLLGGQGPQYYSSTIPDAVARALIDLGFGYAGFGRANYDPANPVIDTVFAVAARPAPDADGTMRLERYDTGPLVTVRPGPPWSSADPGAFGRQETALGADVYTVPDAEVVANRSVTVLARGDDLVVAPVPAADLPAEVQLTAVCPAGTERYLAAPSFVGDVLDPETGWRPVLPPYARYPGLHQGAGMQRVGGPVDAALTLRIHGQTVLPRHPVGCLDRSLLASVAAQPERRPESIEVTGHGIDVRLAPGAADGTVVFGVIRSPGWRCSAGDGPARTPSTAAGLIAVPVEAGVTEVSCGYRPRGLRMGLALGAGALAVVAALAVAAVVVRRRVDHRFDRL
ncbi:YfhO family protein [Jiangella anatolica]|nr:YfhO family protein [Jiangella anatolica]